MPFTRNSKRVTTRKDRGREPDGFFPRHNSMRSPLKDSRDDTKSPTDRSVSTASTHDSTRSSNSPPTLGEEMCPVTGVYADVSEDYYISPKVIGKGVNGIVRECTHRDTGGIFAVKSIEKAKVACLDNLQRELFLLTKVEHPSVMKMVDYYEDADCLHIVTEIYTGGELFDKIKERGRSYGCLSERKTASIIKSLLEAIVYLHDMDIVHRDIKPENVMFVSKHKYSDIKLIDFGLARRHKRGQKPMTAFIG